MAARTVGVYRDADTLLFNSNQSEEMRMTSYRNRIALSRVRPAALLVAGILASTVFSGSAGAMQARPDWFEELNAVGKVPEGSVSLAPGVYSAPSMSEAEIQEYLAGLGLERLGRESDTLLGPEVSIRGSGPFNGVLEARADWASYRLELNGKFASRQVTEVLGQAMTVTAVIDSTGLLVTDDRGGSRTEAYRRFPLDACDWERFGGGCADPASFYGTFDEAVDERGSIVKVVRDARGLPTGMRFGEVLFLRYTFTPPLSAVSQSGTGGRRWREPSSWDLIDLRTSEIVVDSVDVARVATERVAFSLWLLGFGSVLRLEDRETWVLAQGIWSRPYARLPLNSAGSDIWRIVQAEGGRRSDLSFRVDYTDDLVRVELGTEGGERSVVVEAPRSSKSQGPVSFVHPGAEMLTEAMRSGVRLRADEPLDVGQNGAFEAERLPIVLRPFHLRGLVPFEVSHGLVRVKAVSGSAEEMRLEFGPEARCEAGPTRVMCTGGVSDVIGEEPAYPW